MPSEQEINRAVDQYANMLRRICMLYMKNEADCEDIFQTVFLKYLQRKEPFQSQEHEKAWLIRVAINACKDLRRSFFRSRTISLEELKDVSSEVTESHGEVLSAVLSLPQKYKSGNYNVFCFCGDFSLLLGCL